MTLESLKVISFFAEGNVNSQRVVCCVLILIFLFISTVLIVLSDNSRADAFDSCAATLSSGLELHVPIISFQGQSYVADFQLMPGTLEIQLTNVSLLSDVRPFADCRSAVLSFDLTLHIPRIVFGGVSYLADFQYSHDAFLTLIGVGQTTADSVPYELDAASTFQEGCVSPCLCPVTVEKRIAGTFRLVQLISSSVLARFSLDDISWIVTGPDGTVTHRITGFGIYQVYQEGDGFANMHQLILEVSIDNSDLMHFDSGLVPDASQFPRISIAVDRGTRCYDMAMNIVAHPQE